MNINILKLSKIKNKLYKNLLKTKTISNINKYKTFRNSFTKIKRINEKQFYEFKFENSKNDIKTKWLIIKESLKIDNPSTS